jgi:hypothetical protein
MFKIDVTRHVDAMERVLRADADPTRCQEVLGLLRRWQFDKMLDDASRGRAKALVREFAPKMMGRMHSLR